MNTLTKYSNNKIVQFISKINSKLPSKQIPQKTIIKYTLTKYEQEVTLVRLILIIRLIENKFHLNEMSIMSIKEVIEGDSNIYAVGKPSPFNKNITYIGLNNNNSISSTNCSLSVEIRHELDQIVKHTKDMSHNKFTAYCYDQNVTL